MRFEKDLLIVPKWKLKSVREKEGKFLRKVLEIYLGSWIG